MPRAFARLGIGAIFLGLAACGGGGGGGSGGGASGAATVQLLVGDAPVDDLSSFEITITGLYLRDARNVETTNLLASRRTINLVELVSRSSLLESSTVPAGDYVGARLTFDDTSIVARDLMGAVVPVTAVDDEASGTLLQVLPVTDGDSSKLHFDLPLDRTLADDLASPGALLFTPAITVEPRSGSDELLEEIDGKISLESPGDHQLEIVLLDREDAATHGELTVRVDEETLLTDSNGNPFVSERAFFESAGPEDRIEAGGSLADDGTYLADTIHLERGRGRGDDVARIRGSVTALDLASDQLTLRIRTLEFGRAVAGPVLTALGDPAEIQVLYAGGELRVAGDHPRAATENDLAIGQEVKIDFSAFTAAPFPAHEVEIEDEAAEFDGALADDSGLPSDFIVHLADHDPSVQSGLVASSTTDVWVTLDGSEHLFLDLRGEPTVSAADLADGVELELHGVLSGSSDAPLIDPASLRVEPGRLHGKVTAVNQSIGTFVVDIDEVEDPFGGADLPDPVTIRFAAEATVDGDAGNTARFYSLFGELRGGQVMKVDLFGLADGLGGATSWRVLVDVDR